MKCGFCGNEVEDGARKCPTCGAEVQQESGSADSQPAAQYEDPNARLRDGDQGGYNNGQSDHNQGGYNYGQPGNHQGGYNYGQLGGGQGGYNYGQPGNHQGGYNYGQPGGGQGGYNYGQPGNDQGGYGQPGNNYGQPVKQISGTPYMVFSILITLCCCLPLGIASIIYASKINSLQKMGDYAGAQDAAKKAKIFIIVGAVGGLIFSIIAGASGVVDNILGSGTNAPILSDDYWDDDGGDDYDDKDDYEDDHAKPAKKVEISGELGDSWTSFKVQINDKVISFPCAVDEVEAAGLRIDTDDMPEDYMINRDDYELVYFEDANDNDIMFVVCNTSDQALTVKECRIMGIYVNDYDVEDGGLTFVFPGGIQLGMSVDDAVGKWGEPTDSYEGEYSNTYYWYDENNSNYCSISADPSSEKITTIDLDGQDLE